MSFHSVNQSLIIKGKSANNCTWWMFLEFSELCRNPCGTVIFWKVHLFSLYYLFTHSANIEHPLWHHSRREMRPQRKAVSAVWDLNSVSGRQIMNKNVLRESVLLCSMLWLEGDSLKVTHGWKLEESSGLNNANILENNILGTKDGKKTPGWKYIFDRKTASMSIYERYMKESSDAVCERELSVAQKVTACVSGCSCHFLRFQDCGKNKFSGWEVSRIWIWFKFKTPIDIQVEMQNSWLDIQVW